jgi:hypothetical protein
MTRPDLSQPMVGAKTVLDFFESEDDESGSASSLAPPTAPTERRAEDGGGRREDESAVGGSAASAAALSAPYIDIRVRPTLLFHHDVFDDRDQLPTGNL